MFTRWLRALDRFNGAHPWSHNDLYGSVVVRQARAVRRAGGRSALDIGCGTGNLVRRLAGVLPAVTGLEPDGATSALAETATADLPSVQILNTAFPPAPGRFDLVTMVAVLHHLPLTGGLRAARAAVSPGGRLVVVGLACETHGVLSVLSAALNPLIGLVLHPRRARTVPDHMTAPTALPLESIVAIRRACLAELPGATVRRGLFWRYVVVWVAPR